MILERALNMLRDDDLFLLHLLNAIPATQELPLLLVAQRHIRGKNLVLPISLCHL